MQSDWRTWGSRTQAIQFPHYIDATRAALAVLGRAGKMLPRYQFKLILREIMAKTNCPISRQEFKDHAKAIKVMIGDSSILADAREFSTGSLGWYANGKITIDINGKTVSVQVGLNMTIVGSKELPKDEAAT